jgi:hypothetical protein
MVGERAMQALARNVVLGAELHIFLPVTIAEQVATWSARSVPSDPVLAVSDGKLALKADQPRSAVLQSAVEALLAVENFLSLRSIAAPASRLTNAKAWVKWSTLFRTHDWSSVVSAFEAQRLHCEIEHDWDLTREFPDVNRLLKLIELGFAPSSRPAPTRQFVGTSTSSGNKKRLDQAEFLALVRQCEQVSACAKFQIGICRESGDHGSGDALRKHVCLKCSSSSHGNALCTGRPKKKPKTS